MTWDPLVLARVRRLHLQARVLTDSLLMGAHRSRRVGQAVEFADYVEYTPGMDPRFIDWRVWGRSDRVVVRRFESETELPSTVVVDLSADMGTGGVDESGRPDLERSKAGRAITLAATLLYWLYRHGEPIGLQIVAGEDVPFRVAPCRVGTSHLQQLLLTLGAARTGGVAHLRPALEAVGSRTRRRSLLAVLTDGMEEPAEWLPALAAFARRHTDTRFLHVHDPNEWRLGQTGQAVYRSPEDGFTMPVDPSVVRAPFAEVVREYVDEVRAGVTRWGGQYIAVPTDAPLERVFHRLVTGQDLPPEVP